MKIHEYQGKSLLSKYGVPVPDGLIVRSAQQAFDAASKLGGVVVVKSQIHAGGRGKGQLFDKADRTKLVLDGGVKVVKTPDEAKSVALKILGNILVTHQSGPEGKLVSTVLVEKGCDIKKEYYLGLILDRANSCVTIMASSEGGMDIEEVAAKQPEKILKVAIERHVAQIVLTRFDFLWIFFSQITQIEKVFVSE